MGALARGVSGGWVGGVGWGAGDLLVIGAEGLVVHVEEEDIAVVGMGCDGKVLSYCGVLGR